MPQRVLDTYATTSAVDVTGTRSFPNQGPNTGGAPTYPYSSKSSSIKIETSGSCQPNFSATNEGVLCYSNSAAECAPDMWAQATFTYDGSADAAYFGLAIGMDPTTANYTGIEARFVGTGVGTGYFQINQFVNGTGTQIGSNTAGFAPTTGTKYVMRLQSSGKQIIFSIGGTVWLSETLSAALTSSQVYAGLSMYYGSGICTCTWSNFSAGTFDLQVETLSDGNSISWDSRLFASTYTVQSSSTSGGSYTTIATVNAGGPTSYFDPTAGVQYYTVIPNWTNPSTGSGATIGPVASLSSVPNNNVPPSTIIGSTQFPRQNLLTDGTNYFSTDPQKLVFTEVQSQGVPPTKNGFASSPYSMSIIQIETMIGTTGFTGGLVATGSSIGTSTWTGRQFKFSCTAGAGMQTFRNPGALLAPCFAGGFSADPGFTGRVTWGIGADANNGVFASVYCDGANYHFKVYGTTSGTRTVIVADTTFTGPSAATAFEVAADFFMFMYSAWLNTESGWNTLNIAGDAAYNSSYDLRSAATLANWTPMLLVGSDTGDSAAASIAMNEFRMTYTQGSGKVREAEFVTLPDGSPYMVNGLCVIGLDRCIHALSLNDSINNVHCLHYYDPATSALAGQPFCQIFGTFAGVPANAQDCKVMYNPALGGFQIWTPDWATYAGSNPPGDGYTGIWYAFVTSIQGAICPAFTKCTIPSAITGGSGLPYGPDVLYRNGAYYMVCTISVPGTGSFWQTCVISGISPTNLSTLVAFDGGSIGSNTGVTNSEGTNFAVIGSNVYVLAGTINTAGGVQGPVFVWDFSDFAALKPLGQLNYPWPMTKTTNSIPQQPALLVWPTTQGNSSIYLIGMDDDPDWAYPACGNFWSYLADKTLVGTQWPVRAAQPAALLTAPAAIPGLPGSAALGAVLIRET